MFRKGAKSNSITSGPGPIEEDNRDLPKRFHRQYLQQDEIDFVNSGGASKYDVIPKKTKKDSKDKGAKQDTAAVQKIDDSKGPLDEENLDVPKRYQRQLLQQVEVDLVNTGGASQYDVVLKAGNKKAPTGGQAKRKK
ncbi:Ribosomal protein S36, mitochondrial [Popillia japonica]|uniref:Ribosomal protein S36, mitochondrial n=1 Tax=Popillia japonica TaxID=7064 RepID=A0AAW1K0W9_POPJA